MAWKDNLQSVFTIITGDNSSYTPLWTPTSKALEWNISEFEFPEQEGTLVIKRKRKGRRIPIEFYFQGDDHLDLAQRFENSANDTRPWRVQHPYYGTIVCQCPQLSIDHSLYNVSKFTGTLIETITEDNPRSTIDPVDKINADKERLDASFVEAFDVVPNATDINTLSANNNRLYTEGARQVKDPIQASDYFNAFNTANSAINNATAQPLNAIRTTQAVINAPALFASSVQGRVALLSSQFNRLRTTVSTITTRSGKKIYENNAGGVVSALALASANPIEGDYKNATQVLEVISPILDAYNAYIEDLDSLQTDNGGSPDSYIPNATALIGLNSLINFTISNLFTSALSAKQERSIILDVDSNWIIVAHRVYGGLNIDQNIVDLIEANKSGLNELIQIPKGRRIIYYL
jgi:hypothetical protein